MSRIDDIEQLLKLNLSVADQLNPEYAEAIGHLDYLLSRVKGRGAGDGISIIAAERRRQLETEDWTPEHDDEHIKGELAQAAACYAWPPMRPIEVKKAWPWQPWEWKPELFSIDASEDERRATRIQVLAKAGALIAAEIDRLHRAIAPTEGGERCGECGHPVKPCDRKYASFAGIVCGYRLADGSTCGHTCVSFEGSANSQDEARAQAIANHFQGRFINADEASHLQRAVLETLNTIRAERVFPVPVAKGETHPLDAAIREAEDDLRQVVPEMFRESTAATAAGAGEDDDDLPVCLLCRHFQGCDCEHKCTYTALPLDREALLSN
jgi:hypothetical protein